MPEAVVVQNLYKKFGRLQPALWRRFLRREAPNGHNGTTSFENMTPATKSQASPNGHKKQAIAVDRVSFRVQQGEIFGIFGPNGGGKSTLIRLISTLLLPDDGSIQVFGYDVMRQQNGTTILRTNHVMIEAENLCDRIAIMNSSKVIALDTPNQLKHAIPWKDGREPTLEDGFLELTGKKLVNQEEEPEEVQV